VLLGAAVLAYCLGTTFGSAMRSKANQTADISALYEVDFGTLPKGGHGEITVSLHNASGDFTHASDIRTSCDCLKVILDKQYVEPGETVLAKVKVDFKEDPEFSGRLRMTATARGANTISPTLEIVAYVLVE
jgi:hypothetical protein